MKMLINDTPTSNELEFAYQVRRALDERVSSMPEATLNRLSAARKIALAHKKGESVERARVPVRRLAGLFPDGFDGSFDWLGRVAIIVPIVLLVAGSVGIYQYEQERRIDALAELDAAVLSDELPINAYLDHGFDNYLDKHGE